MRDLCSFSSYCHSNADLPVQVCPANKDAVGSLGKGLVELEVERVQHAVAWELAFSWWGEPEDHECEIAGYYELEVGAG